MNDIQFFVLPESMAIRHAAGEKVFTALGEYVPCDYEHTLMLSIRNHDDHSNIFPWHPYRALQSFHFDDVNAGKYGAITQADAKDIACTVLDAIEDGGLQYIIVHCGAGISRSAGVCAAIEKFLTGDDSRIFDSAYYHPNMSCYNAVLEALMEDMM